MESTHNPQRALIKLLAIVGFFALIALILWAIVQGVRAFPAAFSSLASVAEFINNYRPQAELTVKASKDTVNAGEPFTISWNNMGAGSYLFAYECANGLRMHINDQEAECNEDITLNGEDEELTATFESSQQRFAEAVFSFTFEPEEGDVHVREQRMTVVNPEVPLAAEPEDEQETDEEPVVVVEETAPEPKPTTPAPTTPAPTAPKPAAPTVVTYYPPSLPNGKVDLKVTYLGVGTIERGDFIPTSSFDEDDRAAFRFEVRNIGTKTSDSWKYSLTLPGDIDYTSERQTGLQPNERVVFTVGFDLDETRKRTVDIEAEVDVDDDVNARNDSFEWEVRVRD